MNKTKKVGIFGGYFNPPHNGHINCAIFAKDQLQLDEIWVTPTYNSPLKNPKFFVHPIHRLNMVNLAFKNLPFVKVFTWEINRKQVSYTINLVEHLQETYPDIEFVLLIGNDQVAKLHNWKEIHKLTKTIQFYYFSRSLQGNKVKALANSKKYKLKALKNPKWDIKSSSTFDVSWSKHIPLKVYFYILNNNLYFYDYAKAHLSSSRFQHTLAVTRMALKLAYFHNLPLVPVYKAGMMHDIAKEWSYKKQKKYIDNFLPSEKYKPRFLWHSIISADVCNRFLNINNHEVHDAIASHTLPTNHPSTLDKILFCADTIADNRSFEGIQELRETCFEDLEAGFLATIKYKYKYLIDNGIEIDELSKQVYEMYLGIF